MAVITTLNGRSYRNDSDNAEAMASVYNDAKSRLKEYVAKLLDIESVHRGGLDVIGDAFVTSGLTDDDAELAIKLLGNLYLERFQREDATMEHILNQFTEDVSGQA